MKIKKYIYAVFRAEFGSISKLFHLSDLSLDQARSSTDSAVYCPGIYIWYKDKGS